MNAENLKEQLFNHLTEAKPDNGTANRIDALAKEVAQSTAMQPPAVVWQAIEQRMASSSHRLEPEKISLFKAMFMRPLIPAVAVTFIGVLVGAYFLLNDATQPHQVPLLEISSVKTQSVGDVVVARGMKIANAASGNISHIAGDTDKILIASGAWNITTQHLELEKRVQFIFPGGALEPLGTAFEIAVDSQHTQIKVTEGKVRLWKKSLKSVAGTSSAVNPTWASSEASAPFTTTMVAEPLVTDLRNVQTPVAKRIAPASKYASYVGKEITIELKNGDRLTGRLRGSANGQLSLAASSGNLTIREKDIVAIKRN